MSNSIEVINLSKTYKSKQAVNNINFKINENEIVGLLGPNGCGKTTTIGMILGLLKPTKGKVLINAEFITEYLPRLNKDEQRTPMYLSFAEVKQVCLSWFQSHKASDGKATKLKGLSADMERLNKSLLAEIEDDFKKRHDEKIFDKMTMLYNTMNSYRSAYKNLYANNYAILTGKKVVAPQVSKKKSA